MSGKKKVGIVLIIIQVLGIIGAVYGGSTSFDNLFAFLGFCIPGIIGIYMVAKEDSKSQKK